MSSKLETFTVGGHELTIRVSDSVFNPTTTTQKLAEKVHIPEGATVLDLGCGVGPLSIHAALSGAKHVYAVDVVPEAVEFARENVERAGVSDKVTVFCGDLFEPVKGMKFDIICNDVSGIADRAARLSPWYPDAVPTGGQDGTDVVVRMLDQSPSHLNENGILYFATSTLSDASKIVEHAKQVFRDKVEKLASYRFPFCKELTDALGELRQLREDGKVEFDERKSRQIWTLDVFRASLA